MNNRRLPIQREELEWLVELIFRALDAFPPEQSFDLLNLDIQERPCSGGGEPHTHRICSLLISTPQLTSTNFGVQMDLDHLPYRNSSGEDFDKEVRALAAGLKGSLNKALTGEKSGEEPEGGDDPFSLLDELSESLRRASYRRGRDGDQIH